MKEQSEKRLRIAIVHDAFGSFLFICFSSGSKRSLTQPHWTACARERQCVRMPFMCFRSRICFGNGRVGCNRQRKGFLWVDREEEEKKR